MAFFTYEGCYVSFQRYKKRVVSAIKSFFQLALEKKKRAALNKLIYQKASKISTALGEY